MEKLLSFLMAAGFRTIRNVRRLKLGRAISAPIFSAMLFSLELSSPTYAGFLGDEWISEKEMQRQSQFARRYNLLLTELNCKFKEGVEDPGREDVLFRANFEQVGVPAPWGWTFEANAPNPGPEQQAKKAGFKVVGEDYYEITGVTWVRCKLWFRPPQ